MAVDPDDLAHIRILKTLVAEAEAALRVEDYEDVEYYALRLTRKAGELLQLAQGRKPLKDAPTLTRYLFIA